MTPTILTVISLWITAASGLNRSSSFFSSTGQRIIRVLNGISLVLTSIMYVLVGIFFLAKFFGSFETENSGIIIVSLIMLIIFTSIATAHILYYVKLGETLDSPIYVAYAGQPSKYASSYVAVFCFISAFFTLATMSSDSNLLSPLIYSNLTMNYTSSLILETLLESLSPPSTIAWCSIVANICLGVMIFMYRNKMQLAELEHTNEE